MPRISERLILDREEYWKRGLAKEPAGNENLVMMMRALLIVGGGRNLKRSRSSMEDSQPHLLLTSSALNRLCKWIF